MLRHTSPLPFSGSRCVKANEEIHTFRDKKTAPDLCFSDLKIVLEFAGSHLVKSVK